MADDEDRCARKHTNSRYAFTNRNANGAAMNRKRRGTMTRTKHIYEVRRRKDKRGVDLISDNLPFCLIRLMKKLRRQNVVDLKKQAGRVLKASINLVQQRWGNLDRRKHSTRWIPIYEIRPRTDKHGFDLSSDALRYSPLWYRGSNAIGNAVAYARSYSPRHPIVIRVYDGIGNVIETLEYSGDFKEP